MLEFEQKHWLSGKEYIAGIDEAGRGPLAGPVVSAAVIFSRILNCPKLMTQKKSVRKSENDSLMKFIKLLFQWE